MRGAALKLKQASAVLGADPKELQNLVQFGVLRPRWKRGVFLFDSQTLCIARVALYLKQAFGTKTHLLAAYSKALAARMPGLLSSKPNLVVISLRFPKEDVSVECRVPFRRIAEEMNGRMQRAALFRDKPRGRKRPGWKKEFLRLLREAGEHLGEISEDEISEAIRKYRSKRMARPEITIATEA